LITASINGEIYAWDFEGKLKLVFKPPFEGAARIRAISPDGSAVALEDAASHLHIVFVKQERNTQTIRISHLNTHPEKVFFLDPLTLITEGVGQTALWNLRRDTYGERVKGLLLHPNLNFDKTTGDIYDASRTFNSAFRSAEEAQMIEKFEAILVFNKHEAVTLHLSSFKERQRLWCDEEISAEDIRFNSDGSSILAKCGQKLQLVSGVSKLDIPLHTDEVQGQLAYGFSENGRVLAISSSRPGEFQFFDVASATKIDEVSFKYARGPAQVAEGLGSEFYLLSRGDARVWSSPGVVKEFGGGQPSLRELVQEYYSVEKEFWDEWTKKSSPVSDISRDGVIAMADGDRFILLDLLTRRPLGMQRVAGLVSRLSFKEDGNYLAISTDQGVEVWKTNYLSLLGRVRTTAQRFGWTEGALVVDDGGHFKTLPLLDGPLGAANAFCAIAEARFGSKIGQCVSLQRARQD
jgi:WD40 repeat protein